MRFLLYSDITPATFIFITDGAFLRFSASFQRIKRLPE